MASITIRKLDEALKVRLRVQAASHGRSMEEEARAILRGALRDDAEEFRGLGLAERIRRRLAEIGGAEELAVPPPREPMRAPPDFSE